MDFLIIMLILCGTHYGSYRIGQGQALKQSQNQLKSCQDFKYQMGKPAKDHTLRPIIVTGKGHLVGE